MESRSDIASDRKKCGKYNCAQSVAGVYADIVGMDESTINAVTSAFGTGMGTMEGTCGAIVGAGVIAGLILDDRAKGRAAMKNIMTAFKNKNGSTICKDLKGIDTGVVLRDCPGCCEDAALFLEKELLQ